MPTEDVPASNPIRSETDLYELCQTTATRVELYGKDSMRAREAAEKSLELTRGLVKSMQGLATDHAWMRHGIPASWPGRFVVASIGGLAGAIFSSLVSACAINRR